MPLRLSYELEGHRRRATLRSGENLLGSSQECDVVIGHASVSRQHAVVVVAGDSLQLADLGSANGTFIEGRQLQSPVDLDVGRSFSLGAVTLQLEPVDDGDARLSAVVPNTGTAGTPSEDRRGQTPMPTTASTHPLQLFTLGVLPDLVERARSGALPVDVAQAGGQRLQELFGGSLEIRRIRQERVLFSSSQSKVGSTPVQTADDAVVQIVDAGDVRVRFEGPQSRGRIAEPALQAVAGLVDLAIPRTPRRSAESTAAKSPPGPANDLAERTLDPAMQRILRDGARIAQGDISVLILGESGTGKEVLARYLHDHSKRSRGPFLALNCAALPDDLLEAELFGIEGGVATGVEARAGKFEQADGGTLFLDEIGDMSAATQAKLLRALEGHEIFRVGATTARRADVRILAATNRDLESMIADGRFRLDLFHRIADWQCTLPPLRERLADIPNLVAYFLERETTDQEKSIVGVSERTMDLLLAYAWPGNVRELEREIRRAVLLLDDGDVLDSSVLGERLRTESSESPTTLQQSLDAAERRTLERALVATGGVVSAAAERLDVPLSTFYRRLKKYGIASSSE